MFSPRQSQDVRELKHAYEEIICLWVVRSIDAGNANENPLWAFLIGGVLEGVFVGDTPAAKFKCGGKMAGAALLGAMAWVALFLIMLFNLA